MLVVIRWCNLILMGLLLALLVMWILVAPLVWILRDGLAAGMVETTGWEAARKFLIGWGLPAIVIAIFVLGSWFLERYLRREIEIEPIRHFEE